jgi:hypothetical protein
MNRAFLDIWQRKANLANHVKIQLLASQKGYCSRLTRRSGPTVLGKVWQAFLNSQQ